MVKFKDLPIGSMFVFGFDVYTNKEGHKSYSWAYVKTAITGVVCIKQPSTISDKLFTRDDITHINTQNSDCFLLDIN